MVISQGFIIIIIIEVKWGIIKLFVDVSAFFFNYIWEFVLVWFEFDFKSECQDGPKPL